MQLGSGSNYIDHLASAWAAHRQGDFAAALIACHRAIALDAQRFEAWSSLAECEFAARRPEAALRAWEQAIERAPALPLALCGKAAVHRSLGHGRAALELYERATRLDPACIVALLGRAGLHLDAGQTDAALAVLATVPAGERDRPDVLWLAARVALSSGRLPEARDSTERLIATTGLDDRQRADALLLFGEILDEQGDTRTAFQAAVAGKATIHRFYTQRAAGREDEVAKSVRLGAWWGMTSPAAWSPVPRMAVRPAGEAAQHVFLVGFPRSGTTLLEQVLAGHPNVCALEEAPTLADHYAEFLATDDGCARLAALTPAEAERWRARYWATITAHDIDAAGRMFVDKAPAGTLYLPLIARLFPDARILFALRDPRDVVLSCLRNAFQINAMTYAFTTLRGTAACYDAVMAMAAAYRQHLPLALMEVRHEALIDDFDDEIARIGAFLDLAPHAAMADFATTAAQRDVRTPSARQVRAGINRRGVGRWRAYAAELAPVLPLLAPWIAAFGYPPD